MPDDATIERLKAEVRRRFGAAAGDVSVVHAPYRICPLGAHIDHQLGRVSAMALDRGVLLAYAPSPGREVRLNSLVFPGEVRFSIDDVPPPETGGWGNYARGAVLALRQTHRLRRGMVGVTDGRLGEGGLSSSAAVGLAYLLALEDVNELALSERENIVLDQYIENRYLGLNNGILDQAAILLSQRDHLTVVDCATVEHDRIPRPSSMPDFRVLVAFSGLQKALVGTDYNRRVSECAEAATELLAAAGRSGVAPILRNVRPEEYERHKGRLTGPAARRAAHFFSEMERVDHGVAAWRNGDLTTFGRLVTASGRSSIDNYECGAPPLIALYEILIEIGSVWGARFSGAGFRGCCIALVAPGRAERAAAEVRETYARRHAELAAKAPILVCRSDDGARRL
jgi:galacturonokinase